MLTRKCFFYDGEVRYFCGSFLTADGMATASPQFGNRLDFLATKLDSCVILLMLLLLHKHSTLLCLRQCLNIFAFDYYSLDTTFSPGVGATEVEGEQGGDSLGLQDAPHLHRQDALLQVWQATSQVGNPGCVS